jgi:hypothetical protein
MQNKSAIAAVVVFGLIIVGMFVFAYLKKSEITEVAVVPRVEQTLPGPYDSITRIDAKHFFIDGTHTLVGEILMPTPCDLLNWDTQIAESMPEQVAVHFDVINTAESCAQVVTPQRFKVTFTANEKASIRATLEGRDVEINLIPPGEGESPEDFELFIKG